MNFPKPLVFFDLETTGNDRVNDRIVEFSFIRMNIDGTIERCQGRVNPEMPISPAATIVHGITDDMVKDQDAFYEWAPNIYAFIDGCDLVGFGCLAFDMPVLFNEFHRCCISWDYTKHLVIDAGNIYKRQSPRTLSAAFLQYCGSALEGAHGAMADAEATRRVFLRQLVQHEGLPGTVEELALYSNYDQPIVDISGKFALNAEGEIVFNFSNNKGMVAKNDPDFLWWMLDKDFGPDVKLVCRKLLGIDKEPDYAGMGMDDELPF